MFEDKILVCADCREEFLWNASEQDFYAQRQFSEPRRCSACRVARKASRDNDSSGSYGGSERGGQRPMYTAVCGECGRPATVPFQPRGDRPVYCSDCFGQRSAR